MPADAERQSRSRPIVVAPGPPEFELQALGWRAFQDLCGVVLREVFGQSFQIFADSNDAGRDGAYYGNWTERPDLPGTLRDIRGGPCVLQCKFTTKRDQTLTPSVVHDEIRKAELLVARGLCSSYILMTNARVTGESEAAIRAALVAVGVRYALVLQNSWICQTIAASQNLRMFVPRVYGLGDLSQILDERAYAQAASLLSFLDDNLSTFVITDSYNRAAEALRSHGFVLLLGEPAVGKSVIAATLAVTAVDSWGCRTILADDPGDLIRHWNPHEKQFIWVDDAFGMLRHDRTLTNEWARRLPKVMSAIKGGTKVVMTSRDYIYHEARPLLKEYAFPLLREQQVTVDVASLSQDERRQIVYNHVRLGNQPRDVRRHMKPYLADAADCVPFRPEMARRLGRREYTPSLQLSHTGICQFMSKPVELLREVYSGLDSSHISALALVYLAENLPVPLLLNENQTDVLTLLGSTVAATAEALVALEGPFLRRGSLPNLTPGAQYWSFRHPTLREGFAAFIGNNPNLVDMFVTGLSDEALLTQVDCGSEDQRGILFTLPPSLYEHVADRLANMQALDGNHRDLEYRRYLFLADRLSRKFLELYLARDPELIDKLLSFVPYLSAVPEPRLLAQLYREGLLSEDKRKAAIQISSGSRSIFLTRNGSISKSLKS